MKKNARKSHSYENPSADASREWPHFLDKIAKRSEKVVKQYRALSKARANGARRERKDDKRRLAYAYAQFALTAARSDIRDQIVTGYLKELELEPKGDRPLSAIVAKHLNLAGDQKFRKPRNEAVLAIKYLIAERVAPDKVVDVEGGIRDWSRKWHNEDSANRKNHDTSKSASDLTTQIERYVRAKPGSTITVKLKVVGPRKYKFLGQIRTSSVLLRSNPTRKSTP